MIFCALGFPAHGFSLGAKKLCEVMENVTVLPLVGEIDVSSLATFKKYGQSTADDTSKYEQKSLIDFISQITGTSNLNEIYESLSNITESDAGTNEITLYQALTNYFDNNSVLMTNVLAEKGDILRNRYGNELQCFVDMTIQPAVFTDLSVADYMSAHSEILSGTYLIPYYYTGIVQMSHSTGSWSYSWDTLSILVDIYVVNDGKIVAKSKKNQIFDFTVANFSLHVAQEKNVSRYISEFMNPVNEDEMNSAFDGLGFAEKLSEFSMFLSGINFNFDNDLLNQIHTSYLNQDYSALIGSSSSGATIYPYVSYRYMSRRKNQFFIGGNLEWIGIDDYLVKNGTYDFKSNFDFDIIDASLILGWDFNAKSDNSMALLSIEPGIGFTALNYSIITNHATTQSFSAYGINAGINFRFEWMKYLGKYNSEKINAGIVLGMAYSIDLPIYPLGEGFLSGNVLSYDGSLNYKTGIQDAFWPVNQRLTFYMGLAFGK